MPLWQRFAKLGIDLVSISHSMWVWHTCHTTSNITFCAVEIEKNISNNLDSSEHIFYVCYESKHSIHEWKTLKSHSFVWFTRFLIVFNWFSIYGLLHRGNTHVDDSLEPRSLAEPGSNPNRTWTEPEPIWGSGSRKSLNRTGGPVQGSPKKGAEPDRTGPRHD